MSDSPTTSGASSPTSPPLSVAEAQAIAQEAYVFGLPLVYQRVQADLMTNVPKPEGIRAPVNQFAHYRAFPDATNRSIVGLNVDTLYSLACLDLSAEPIVLSVPPMGDRYWLMQILDAWNDVPGAPGARTVGGAGGAFALVGPNWTGAIPADLTTIQCDTNLTIIGGRTYTAGPDDYANVHTLQDLYRLIPLSRWGTEYTPPATVPVKAGVDGQTPPPKQVVGMSAETYFSRLCTLLVDNPPRPADAPVLARMAQLGIAPGAAFCMDGFSPEVQDAIEAGKRAGQQEVEDGHARMGEKVGGWQLARDLGRYGTKYAYRATWTYYAVGGNLVEDAFYPTTSQDGAGNALDGAQAYRLHFAPDQLPPVNAFWSLTMYDADSYLVPNPLDRYALGDRSALTYADDGSLTLYLQQESPGAEKESNWLPTPEEGMLVALRLYWPKETVADGSWNPPPIERIE